MSSFLQDLHHAWQSLRRAPGFLTTVAATLALGVGASVAMFTFVNGVLLRPLPYPQADRLVQVCETHPERSDWCGAAPGNLWDWQEQASTLETVGLGRTWPFSLASSDGRFQAVRGGIATVELFDTFGVAPRLGRLFEPSDHQQGGDHVALLSHSLWRSRFGSDESLLGRSIQVDTDSYRVIGVLPEGFEVPRLEGVELWLPLWADRVDWRDWRGLQPFGRLAEGASLEQAQAELAELGRVLAERYPESNGEWGIRVVGLHDRMVAPARPALLVFTGAVGAPTVVLYRSVLAGALVTTAVGLVTGLGGGLALSRVLRSLLVEVTTTDAATYLSVALLLVAVAVAAAAVPARRATRIEPTECLREE